MGSGMGSYGSTYGTSPSSWESEGRWGSQSGSSQSRGQFSGKGPKGYQRSDERIREDVSDALERNGELDASEIEVKVEGGEVTLEGTVNDRQSKRLAEDLIEDFPGVKQVHNRLRVEKRSGSSEASSSGTGSASGSGSGSGSGSSSSQEGGSRSGRSYSSRSSSSTSSGS